MELSECRGRITISNIWQNGNFNGVALKIYPWQEFVAKNTPLARNLGQKSAPPPHPPTPPYTHKVSPWLTRGGHLKSSYPISHKCDMKKHWFRYNDFSLDQNHPHMGINNLRISTMAYTSYRRIRCAYFKYLGRLLNNNKYQCTQSRLPVNW